MEEGTIIKWLKAPGDEVHVGDGLADVETDKTTVTYEADAAALVPSSLETLRI
jgi:pyruvate dehydrogenase E2 component (dihydrolipoamide acetyltransferase)